MCGGWASGVLKQHVNPIFMLPASSVNRWDAICNTVRQETNVQISTTKHSERDASCQTNVITQSLSNYIHVEFKEVCFTGHTVQVFCGFILVSVTPVGLTSSRAPSSQDCGACELLCENLLRVRKIDPSLHFF